MAQTLMPSVGYVEAHHRGGRQKPKAIVIKLSSTTSGKGAALGIARWWHNRSSPVESCHYVVDEASTYQCVPDTKIAYPSAVSSKGSISINVCAMPLAFDTFWQDTDHINVLIRTAQLVAELSSLHRIPVQYLDGVEKSRWNRPNWFSRKGILIRTIGVWPKELFVDLVEQYKI